jgi:hypothetical protein
MAVRTRAIPLSVEQLLLVGHPGEILGDAELERMWAHAQWYVGEPAHPESARTRVTEVWIKGRYLPAWDARDGAPADTKEGHI